MSDTKAETTSPAKPDGTRENPYNLSELTEQGKNGGYKIRSNDSLPKGFWDEFEKRSEIFFKDDKNIFRISFGRSELGTARILIGVGLPEENIPEMTPGFRELNDQVASQWESRLITFWGEFDESYKKYINP